MALAEKIKDLASQRLTEGTLQVDHLNDWIKDYVKHATGSPDMLLIHVKTVNTEFLGPDIHFLDLLRTATSTDSHQYREHFQVYAELPFQMLIIDLINGITPIQRACTRLTEKVQNPPLLLDYKRPIYTDGGIEPNIPMTNRTSLFRLGQNT